MSSNHRDGNMYLPILYLVCTTAVGLTSAACNHCGRQKPNDPVKTNAMPPPDFCPIAHELWRQWKGMAEQEDVQFWACVAGVTQQRYNASLAYKPGKHPFVALNPYDPSPFIPGPGVFSFRSVDWCQIEGMPCFGSKCNMDCRFLEDNNFRDDIGCIRKVMAEYKWRGRTLEYIFPAGPECCDPKTELYAKSFKNCKNEKFFSTRAYPPYRPTQPPMCKRFDMDYLNQTDDSPVFLYNRGGVDIDTNHDCNREIHWLNRLGFSMSPADYWPTTTPVPTAPWPEIDCSNYDSNNLASRSPFCEVDGYTGAKKKRSTADSSDETIALEKKPNNFMNQFAAGLKHTRHGYEMRTGRANCRLTGDCDRFLGPLGDMLKKKRSLADESTNDGNDQKPINFKSQFDAEGEDTQDKQELRSGRANCRLTNTCGSGKEKRSLHPMTPVNKIESDYPADLIKHEESAETIEAANKPKIRQRRYAPAVDPTTTPSTTTTETPPITVHYFHATEIGRTRKSIVRFGV